ncbi:putative uncharacterized protein [Burkholderiales bacterium GJ-E10]|nr:putative uncharacterized protein [Burkholderiales bacterium GJ-E10]
MKNPPSIQEARVVGVPVIEIRWSTGETLPVDLRAQIHPPFDALVDDEFFSRMHVSEWGDGLDWPGGLDIGADRLYELARQQAGLMTPDEFGAWMDRNGLSLSSAAQSLGMTRRMIAHYRTGSKPIPKVVGLACKGWDALAEKSREHGGAVA